jgi:hypothetical protein
MHSTVAGLGSAALFLEEEIKLLTASCRNLDTETMVEVDDGLFWVDSRPPSLAAGFFDATSNIHR